MPSTTTRTTKRLTRADRDRAREAAASKNATMDLRPAAMTTAAVVGVVAFAFVAGLLVPGGGSFGGPLQPDRLESGSTMSAIDKTKGKPVTLGVPVPWNAGAATVELEGLAPIGAEGVEVIRAAAVPLGSPPVPDHKGFPPDAAVLQPIEHFAVPPGADDSDGFQIVVGLRGAGTVQGFALTYRLGGVRHVAILGHGAMLCPKTCEGLDEAETAQRSALGSLAPFVDAPVR